MIKDLLSTLLRFVCIRFAQDLEGRLPDGPALVLAPHPDDETLGCGATIARFRREGRTVRVVIVTDGTASTPSQILSPDNLATVRRLEAQRALHALGVAETDLVFLSYPDGKAAETSEAIEKDIAAQIWIASPVLVFYPYAIDKHPDHRAVAQIVARLRQNGKLTCRALAYPMWFWPKGALSHLRQPALFRSHRRLATDVFLEAKQEALKAYRSQLGNLTGEKEWRFLDKAFLRQNMGAYELFFEELAPPRP